MSVLVGVRRERSRWRRRAAWAALALVLIAAALIWRVSSEQPPPIQLQRTLAAYVRMPGRAPAFAWPREGQAAVEVPGVGTAASPSAQRPVPIASVAKVMTAYLTLREHPLAPGAEGFEITITPAEVTEEGERMELDESVAPVRAGERLSERQALAALLLPSANNVAALLAVHDAGSIPAFLARMNRTARELGMRSTTYTDPSGFEQGTVSTASDQLRLARVAIRIHAFAHIVDESSARLPVAGRVFNYDALVGSEGFVGIKTGSDDAAGGCLMFAKRALLAGRRLTVLGVVLGQRSGALVEAALQSARTLARSAAASVREGTFLPRGTRVLRVSAADGRSTTVTTSAALRGLGWGGSLYRVSVAASAGGRRVRAGQPLASVTVAGAGSVRASALHELPGPSLGWRLAHVL